MISVVVGSSLCGARADAAAAELLSISRSRAQKLIESRDIRINGEVVKAKTLLRAGDVITMEEQPPVALEAVAEDIPLDIVYEDDSIAVINKAKGMVVHAAPGNEKGTLVNALLAHMGDSLSGIGGIMRPGIVHRIDKQTSGLLVIAKNDEAHTSLSEQIAQHSARRTYIAVVEGNLREESGTVNVPIGRHISDRKKYAAYDKNPHNVTCREAVTDYSVLARMPAKGRIPIAHTLVEARLRTGRTHQIRVHMAYIKHPLAGDEVYGHGDKYSLKLDGQALHAVSLTLMHPKSGQIMQFFAPPPQEFMLALCTLGLCKNEIDAILTNYHT